MPPPSIRPGPPPVIPTRVPSPTMPPVVVARPDPLAVTLANGTTFTPVDRAQLANEATKALKLGADVPARVQDGPTCGLYALGMVMDFWDKKDPAKAQTALVQDSDVVRWDSHHQQPDTQRRLLDVAKQKGFTTQGEMFHSRQLATLARSFGYGAKVTDTLSLDEIHAAVDRGNPALIGFDVDNNGNPGLFEGKRAHWAVIEGHFQKDGVEFLVATHGWTGKEYVWRAEDFMASVNQLNKSDFVGAPADITQTIKGLMVEVYPKK